MEELCDSLGIDMPSLSPKHIYRVLTRKKPLEDSNESKLAKVLSAFDLTALGIGSTLGVGVYVLAGQVSKLYAGPAVVISFLIAAIASVFAGLCYAEFGARVPKAGSAYIYSYVTMGEFTAFIIGWNLILEYAIGSASVVKGLSEYLDSLFGNAMRNFLITYLPMRIEGLGDYPDIFAFTVTILFTWAIAIGAKESTRLNNVFTMLNLGVVLFVIITGLFKVKTSNWLIPKSAVPTGYGDGGFMPYGFAGVIRGAAVCFYGFIGFDCIATAGEEAKNPNKSIPFAVITSLAMVFLAYFGVSTVLTMMLSYFEQDETAPLPHVFRIYGWYIAEYIVTIGALFGLCASLMGAMFPLPRIVFAMATDGLLFRFMGEISTKYKTPFNGTLFTGFLTALLAALFNLSQLVNMMSIGTLLAYSMVASCVMILRYDSPDRRTSNVLGVGRTLNENEEIVAPSKRNRLWQQLLNNHHVKFPTVESARLVTIMTTLFFLGCFWFAQVLSKFEKNTHNITLYDVLHLAAAGLLLFVALLIIALQPVSCVKLPFEVPFVPWLPGISILINVYLMIKLDILTWLRFALWIVIGLFIYFGYGIRYSRLRPRGNILLMTLKNTAGFNGALKENSSQTIKLRDADNNSILLEQINNTAVTDGAAVPLMVLQNSSI